MSSAGSVLADRPASAQNMQRPLEEVTVNTSNNNDNKNTTIFKPADMRRQILDSPGKEQNSTRGKYVSPSDNILSPASQKLSQFRNKNLMKKAKPRTLFSRNNTENSVTMQSSDSKMHDESVGAVEE